MLDVGRPWNMINPVIGNDFGMSSILFLVAWHFMLYMGAQFLEFSPAVAEWANWRRLRRILGGLTLGAVIFGITLSVLHQSGLGALFLMAKPKIHPLWYNEFIPILFLVSSIFSGLGVVIILEWVSNRVFRAQTSDTTIEKEGAVAFGLARVCVGAMFVYLFLLILTFVHGHNWVHVGTPMFTWYLVEVLGFVVLPLAAFMHGLFERRIRVIRFAALAAVAGIVLNRLNVALVAFNWNAPHRYVPTWMEIVISVSVIFAQLWAYRWIVLRMPVRAESPAWVAAMEREKPISSDIETEAATKVA
jgi:Ni/Fe-hydrogenase subunit HybB-like protein